MHSRALLVRLSAVLGFVMVVTAQGPAVCLPGWEWVRHLLLLNQGVAPRCDVDAKNEEDIP